MSESEREGEEKRESEREISKRWRKYKISNQEYVASGIFNQERGRERVKVREGEEREGRREREG